MKVPQKLSLKQKMSDPLPAFWRCFSFHEVKLQKVFTFVNNLSPLVGNLKKKQLVWLFSYLPFFHIKNFNFLPQLTSKAWNGIVKFWTMLDEYKNFIQKKWKKWSREKYFKTRSIRILPSLTSTRFSSVDFVISTVH